MFELLRETDRRLVIAFGDRASRWTRIILDHDAGRAWFERHHPYLPARTSTVRLKAIASIGTQTVTRGAGASDILSVATTKARYRFVGNHGSAQQAAARMRTFLGLYGQQAPHVTRSASPLVAWAKGAVAVSTFLVVAVTAVAILASVGNLVVGIAGKAGSAASDMAGRVGRKLSLPACDAPESRDTVLELVRDRLGPSATLADIADDGVRSEERFCRALARRDGKVATIHYRNYRDGWSAKVRLAGEIVTSKLDAARTAAIESAAEAILAASRNSHLSGNPPRQSDPAVDAALATVFGASDLAAEPLLAREIDMALQWFATANRIGAIYMLAGTGFEDFASVSQTEAVQRRLRSNVVAFADEFGRYVDFQLIILSAIANAEMRLSTASPHPTSRTGEIGTLLSQAMTGNFIALVFDGHNDPWRMARLTALGRAAPVAAKMLTKEDARAVREQALQTVDYLKDERVRARVREIAAMLPQA